MAEQVDPRLRVLVVDDDRVARLLAINALANAGFAVDEAEDGQKALAAIEESPPDLVVLDVEMPGLDGFETCAMLRRRPVGREIPVLISTGRTDAESIDRAFLVGATDFIVKPFDPQLLFHRVRFLLRASTAIADLRESQQRLANAQRLASLGDWEWKPGTEEMIWSDQMQRILGTYPLVREMSYRAFIEAVHPDDRVGIEKAMRKAASDGVACTVDHTIVTQAGERSVRQHMEIIQGSRAAGAARVSGTIQDITDQRRAQEKIHYLACYDSVTALPNRKMLREHLDRSIEAARERGGDLALLFVNLDRFKRINDTLGYDAGDELLRMVAGRLLKSVRTADTVGRPQASSAPVSRLGGDEFGIALSFIRTTADADPVARRVIEVLRQPFSLRGQDVVIGASVGVALFPTDGDDGEALLANANIAMEHAKEAGGGIYRFFSETMNERAMRNLQLEIGLRSAIEEGRLALHFQPQRDIRSGAITGAEALARWESPEFGSVAPSEFIPLAEETGLIAQLGTWALRQTCAQAARWERDGRPPLRIAVNVSSHQVSRPDLFEIVESALADADLPPDRLELELTESALMGEEPAVEENLRRLRELGVRLALDDFGTGYSSLSHLVRFHIDTLKIDRSFVSEIGGQGQADAIIPAVVALAHRLGMKVIAEGVETIEQEEFLRAEGCDFLQGYRIARPMDAQAFTKLLETKDA